MKKTALRMAATAVLPLLPGCQVLTDGATRLAFDLEANSSALRRSGSDARSFTHQPVRWPDGVTGDYEVVLQESLHHPGAGGSLLVGDLGSRNYSNWGYNWSTTYHLHFVRVPKPLSIRKAKGELVTVDLVKNGPHTDVRALR